MSTCVCHLSLMCHCNCVPLTHLIFRCEASTKCERWVTKRKGLWEGEGREARRVWPVFSFPPSSERKFSSKRLLGTREVIVKGMV